MQAKIHIRSYEYGYGETLFILPYIYGTYIYLYGLGQHAQHTCAQTGINKYTHHL